MRITGGGSRCYAGRKTSSAWRFARIAASSEYEPRELVVTARAGTPLAEIEAELAGAGQMLAFEPPHFAETATLGGAIASGLSGPRRPYAGAARDFVLGCCIINGHGEVLRFGGQVMKNVAGYDVSRLMAGAWGTLGVLLDVSLKVLPQPQASLTVVREYPLDQALLRMRGTGGQAAAARCQLPLRRQTLSAVVGQCTQR